MPTNVNTSDPRLDEQTATDPIRTTLSRELEGVYIKDLIVLKLGRRPDLTPPAPRQLKPFLSFDTIAKIMAAIRFSSAAHKTTHEVMN